MIGKSQSLRPQGGLTKDGDRLALAVAISSASDARRAVEASKASMGRAHRFVDECEERLASATAGVTAAREALAQRVTSAAQAGTALSPDSEMRNARAEELDAADSLEAARAALAAVEATLEGPIEDLKVAERRVDEAVKSVLSRHLAACRTQLAINCDFRRL
jgi:hypothetical protein